MADVEVELLHVAGHHGRGGVRGRPTVPQHHVRRCPGGPASAHQVLPHHPATAHCTEVQYPLHNMVERVMFSYLGVTKEV